MARTSAGRAPRRGRGAARGRSTNAAATPDRARPAQHAPAPSVERDVAAFSGPLSPEGQSVGGAGESPPTQEFFLELSEACLPARADRPESIALAFGKTIVIGRLPTVQKSNGIETIHVKLNKTNMSVHNNLLSRVHASVAWQGSDPEHAVLVLKDGNGVDGKPSTNGTAVNGVLMSEREKMVLHVGDEVEFGVPHLKHGGHTPPKEFVYRVTSRLVSHSSCPTDGLTACSPVCKENIVEPASGFRADDDNRLAIQDGLVDSCDGHHSDEISCTQGNSGGERRDCSGAHMICDAPATHALGSLQPMTYLLKWWRKDVSACGTRNVAGSLASPAAATPQARSKAILEAWTLLVAELQGATKCSTALSTALSSLISSEAEYADENLEALNSGTDGSLADDLASAGRAALEARVSRLPWLLTSLLRNRAPAPITLGKATLHGLVFATSPHQAVGSCNWLHNWLSAEYGHVAKGEGMLRDGGQTFIAATLLAAVEWADAVADSTQVSSSTPAHRSVGSTLALRISSMGLDALCSVMERMIRERKLSVYPVLELKGGCWDHGHPSDSPLQGPSLLTAALAVFETDCVAGLGGAANALAVQAILAMCRTQPDEKAGSRDIQPHGRGLPAHAQQLVKALCEWGKGLICEQAQLSSKYWAIAPSPYHKLVRALTRETDAHPLLLAMIHHTIYSDSLLEVASCSATTTGCTSSKNSHIEDLHTATSLFNVTLLKSSPQDRTSEAFVRQRWGCLLHLLGSLLQLMAQYDALSSIVITLTKAVDKLRSQFKQSASQWDAPASIASDEAGFFAFADEAGFFAFADALISTTAAPKSPCTTHKWSQLVAEVDAFHRKSTTTNLHGEVSAMAYVSPSLNSNGQQGGYDKRPRKSQTFECQSDGGNGINSQQHTTSCGPRKRTKIH